MHILIHTTETFKLPMGVTESNTQLTPGFWQTGISLTMLGPVDTLISTRAFAQAAVLTSHRNTAQRPKI